MVRTRGTRFILLLTVAILISGIHGGQGVVVAADVPGEGTSSRKFDPKKDCKCLFQRIEQVKKLRQGYLKLAEEYKEFLKDLGDGTISPTWVNIKNLSKQQRRRLVLFNRRFNEKEKAMAASIPAAKDCNFPEKEIILETDSVTGAPPTPEEQKKARKLFPFDELFEAALAHEYYHAGEFTKNNPGLDANSLPKARTPYGRALEEAAGYAVELKILQKLAKQCKVSFKGVTMNARGGGVVFTVALKGDVCGDPYAKAWNIHSRLSVVAMGRTMSARDSRADTECVLPGSDAAKAKEKVFTSGHRSATGWYCMFTLDPTPTVTIRMPKLNMGAVPFAFDGPKNHTVEAGIGACDDSQTPPDKGSDLPVS